MCRNIHTLHNFEPPATDEEIRGAALQYVRKISGFNKPSKANEEAFARALDEVAAGLQARQRRVVGQRAGDGRAQRRGLAGELAERQLAGRRERRARHELEDPRLGDFLGRGHQGVDRGVGDRPRPRQAIEGTGAHGLR